MLSQASEKNLKKIVRDQKLISLDKANSEFAKLKEELEANPSKSKKLNIHFIGSVKPNLLEIQRQKR